MSPSPATILVVDDDPAIRSTIADFLEMEGYVVETACDGVDALKRLETFHPSLVLLDMRMPRMDGWGFAAELTRRGTRLPVAVLTAASDAHLWAREVGAVGCLPKPFDLAALLQLVEQCRAETGSPPAGDGDRS